MKTTTKILTLLVIGVFAIAIAASAITSNENNTIGVINTGDMAIAANNSVHNKGMIFKIGGDKVIATHAFKANISAGETINYALNTTGWGDVTVRFYSDDGVDVNITDKKFKNIKKKDHKVKGGQSSVDISIKGKKKGKYRIVVTAVKKKDGDGKVKHPDIKQKN